MRLRRLASIALVAMGLSALAGCGQDEPASLGWYVDFTDSDARGRAVMIEARLRRGACDGAGELLFSTDIFLHEASTPVQVPVLSPGEYAFSARARDSACSFYADGCRTAGVPGTREVVVLVAASASETPGCAACDGGHCATEAGCGACPGGANATATCSAGACDLRCDPDFEDCDGRPENGCEAALLDSEVHCGECDMRCPSAVGLACCSGVCTLAPCSR